MDFLLELPQMYTYPTETPSLLLFPSNWHSWALILCIDKPIYKIQNMALMLVIGNLVQALLAG